MHPLTSTGAESGYRANALTGLPPALIVVGAEDGLLQDNLAMAVRLAAAGVDVRSRGCRLVVLRLASLHRERAGGWSPVRGADRPVWPPAELEDSSQQQRGARPRSRPERSPFLTLRASRISPRC